MAALTSDQVDLRGGKKIPRRKGALGNKKRVTPLARLRYLIY